MTFKQSIVQALDDAWPSTMGNLRYLHHVAWRKQVVFPDVARVLYERLGASSSVAVDVGANVGLFTRFLSRNFSHVISVEPVLYLADRLHRSGIGNCTVVAAALGDREGELVLRIPRDSTGREMHALSTASDENALSMIASVAHVERKVPVTTLDTVIAGSDRVAFVKIDVEGYEATVLSGAEQMLKTVRPVLQMEIGRAHNPRYLKLLELLHSHDYQVFALQDDGLYPNAVGYIEAQPTSVSDEESGSPQGCWDYLCVPAERVASLTAGLVR